MPGMGCCSPSLEAKEKPRFSYTEAHTDDVPDGRRRARCRTSIFFTACDGGTWLLALDSRNNLVANLRTWSAQCLPRNQCSAGECPVSKVSQPPLEERNNSPPGEKLVHVTLKVCSVKIARHVPSCGTRAPSRSCGPTSHATYRPPGEKDAASF